eukprot:141912-Chlamydomonas_euryale.AAC.10
MPWSPACMAMSTGTWAWTWACVCGGGDWGAWVLAWASAQTGPLFDACAPLGLCSAVARPHVHRSIALQLRRCACRARSGRGRGGGRGAGRGGGRGARPHQQQQPRQQQQQQQQQQRTAMVDPAKEAHKIFDEVFITVKSGAGGNGEIVEHNRGKWVENFKVRCKHEDGDNRLRWEGRGAGEQGETEEERAICTGRERKREGPGQRAEEGEGR